MPALSEEVQTFIVQALACYRKPSLIVKDVKAEFGAAVTLDQVRWYDPGRGSKSKRIARKWRDLFTQTRAAFNADKVQIGIAKQSYRLMLYQRAAEYYEGQGNFVLASRMAERAAKEVGGAYTNKRTVTVEGLEGARRALAVMLDEFGPQLQAGTLSKEQIVQMVASDHGVDEVALATEVVS